MADSVKHCCKPLQRPAHTAGLAEALKKKILLEEKCSLVTELPDKANRCLHLEPLCGTIDLSLSLMCDLSHLTDFARFAPTHSKALKWAQILQFKRHALVPVYFFPPLRLPAQCLDKRQGEESFLSSQLVEGKF